MQCISIIFIPSPIFFQTHILPSCPNPLHVFFSPGTVITHAVQSCWPSSSAPTYSEPTNLSGTACTLEDNWLSLSVCLHLGWRLVSPSPTALECWPTWSWAGSYSCCELRSTLVLSSPQTASPSPLQLLTPNLSNLFSMFPKLPLFEYSILKNHKRVPSLTKQPSKNVSGEL